MKYLFKAVSTNTRDCKTGILLIIDESRYLFNTPEGLCRILGGTSFYTKKYPKYVFISSLHPNYFGGFPGLMLTSRMSLQTFPQDSRFYMTVLGPKRMRDLMINSTRFLGNLHTVRFIEINEESSKNEQKFGLYYNKHNPGTKYFDQPKKVLFKEDNKLVFNDSQLRVYPLEISNGVNPVFSYICVPNQGKGVFHLSKAQQFPGLQPGYYKALVEGHTVTLPDGTEVKPSDVCDEPAPSQNCAFLFAPDESYLEGLIKAINEIDVDLVTFYHSIPKEIMMNPRYQQALQRFGATHVLDAPESNLPQLTRSAANFYTEKIKMICPNLFPMPQVKDLLWKDSFSKISKEIGPDFPIHQSFTDFQYDLYPIKSQGLSSAARQAFTQEFETQERLKNELAVTLQRMNSQILDPPNYDEPSILFLGTASTHASNLRGASAIYYLNSNGYGILMDCAEGSYGQLMDHFGDQQKVNEVLIKTKAIFITHIHGDHQLGILRMLAERDALKPQEKIYVIAPTTLIPWLKVYINDSLENPRQVVLVPSTSLNPEKYYYYEPNRRSPDGSLPLANFKLQDQSQEIMDKKISEFTPLCSESKKFLASVKEDLGIEQIIAFEVDHCPQSFGVLLKTKDYGKIVYSGDTRPCQNLINYAKGCKILIHEATFASNLQKEAALKKHTTTQEAMELIEKIKPWRSILTHFSLRVQSLPELPKGNTMIAFDHMRLSLCQFENAHQYLETIKKLFGQSQQSGYHELKNRKKQFRKQKNN